jgi:ribosomal protein S8
MSSNDPISELCTQIRNGQSAGHSHIKTSQSKLKLSILSVL